MVGRQKLVNCSNTKIKRIIQKSKMDGYADLTNLHDIYQMQPASEATPTLVPCVSLVDLKISTTPLEHADKSEEG